jgi:hypothetical protein
VLENGEWRFYPTKPQIERLKVNGYSFDQSPERPIQKRYICMKLGVQISADPDNTLIFELMTAREAMRHITSVEKR